MMGKGSIRTLAYLVPCLVLKDGIPLRYEYFEDCIMSRHGNYAFSQSPNRFIFITTFFLIWHA